MSKKVSAQVASTQAPVKATAAAALAKKDQEEEARQAQIAEAAGEIAENEGKEQVAASDSGETVEAARTIATVAEEVDASAEALAGVVADAPMMFAQAGAAAAGGAAAGGISTAAIVAGVAVVGVAAAVASSDDDDTPADTVQTFTLTEALAAEELPEVYSISDGTLDLGELSVAEATALSAQVGDILEGASNGDAVEVVATYTLADTLANLEAEADDEDGDLLENAASYSLTDPEGALGNVTEAQTAIVTGATNSSDYTFGVVGRTFTLTEALAAEELPEAYEISDASTNAGEVSVAQAVELLASVTAILSGATNAADFADPASVSVDGSLADTLANIEARPANIQDTPYSVIDTLANLEAGDAEVLAAATSYALTNAAGSLGSLSADQQAIVIGATNAADYSFGGNQALLTTVDTLIGTAGDDLITGVVDPLASKNTLNATDNINGGAGRDELSLTVGAASFAGFTGIGGLSNVEEVTLTSNTVTARDFSFSGATGVETINVVVPADRAAVTLSNLDFIPQDINVTGLAATAALTYTVGFKNADVTKATTDSITLGVTNSGRIDDPTTAVDESRLLTLTVAGIESVALNAQGTNNVALGIAAAKSLTVAGSGTLQLAAADFTALKTVDASEYTGNLTFNADTAAGLTSVALGSGNDTLTIGAGDVNAAGTIAGGEGTDRLVISDVAGAVEYTMSGIQSIQLGTGGATPVNLGANFVFSARNTSDLESVTITKTTANGATFTSLGAGSLTVNVQGEAGTAGGNTFLFDQSGAATLTFSKAPNETGTAAVVNKANVTFTEATSLDVTVGASINYTSTAVTDGTILAPEATSLALAIAGATTGAVVTVAKANTVDILSVAKDSTLVVNADVASSITVVANGGTLDLTASASKATAFESTAGEAVTINAAGDLSGVQSLTVTQTAGTFTGSGEFTGLNVANLSGAGIVTLGDVGSATQAYELTVNSTIGGALTLGAVNTLGADITINASRAQAAVAIGAVNSRQGLAAATDAGNIYIDVSRSFGPVTQTGASSGRDFTIDASGVLGAVSFGEVTGRDVTLTATSALSTVAFGAVTGRDVVLNLATTGNNAVTVGDVAPATDITASRSVTINGPSLVSINTVDAANGVVSIAHAAAAESLTVSLTGGALVDSFSITGTAATRSITVTGNLGAGNDTIVVDGAANTTTSQTLSIAGLTGVTNSTITGGAGADTITGGAGADIITGGAGADTLTGGAGADTFVIAAAADSSATVTDHITDFVGGTDEIKFVAGGSFEALTDDGTIAAAAGLGAATTAAFVLADVASNDGIEALQFTYAGRTYFAIEATTTSEAVGAVVIDVTGLTGTVAVGDFIA